MYFDYEDYEDYDSDDLEAYMPEPGSLEFQLYGYGGFGYNTDHVPKDDDVPDIVRYAKTGNIEGVKAQISMVRKKARKAKKEQRNKKLDKGLRFLINSSQRWTECDYKMSGFVKTWEWHNLTPLAAAAIQGHSEIVRILLETGVADPTLTGCPTDNEYYDAYQAAEKGSSETVKKMLDAVKPYWNTASYSSMHYSKDRVEKGYNNSCTDIDAMRSALAAVE